MTVFQTYACLLVGHVTCLALGALLAMRLLPRSASLRHTIGVTAWLFILISPVTVAVLPVGGVGGLRLRGPTDSVTADPHSVGPQHRFPHDAPAGLAGDTTVMIPARPAETVGGRALSFDAPMTPGDADQSSPTISATAVSWGDGLLLAWGLGTLLTAGRLLWRTRAYRRYRRLVTTTGVPWEVSDPKPNSPE